MLLRSRDAKIYTVDSSSVIAVTNSSNQVQALTALLEEVIHSLDMAQYSIEDGATGYTFELQAQEYFDRMLAILHSDSGATPESVSET